MGQTISSFSAAAPLEIEVSTGFLELYIIVLIVPIKSVQFYIRAHIITFHIPHLRVTEPNSLPYNPNSKHNAC